ncbi:MAG: substrate-binding domain-containing protein [Lachnospiraceae bacterium]|nr:substrate-binding domain-containing protein [Lachnospiraceae bacterium]
MNYINLLSENSYKESVWYKRIRSGIVSKTNHRRDVILDLSPEDIAGMEKDSVLLIVGFSQRFLSEAVDLCFAHGVRPLIVGSALTHSADQHISFVAIKREAAMYENVANLFNSGCRHVAMIGVNPQVSTDVSHKEGYVQAVTEHGCADYEKDIFYNTLGINKAIDSFIEVRENYDAVVCNNDFVAVLLLSRLNELGVKVPEEISVTGAGNMDFCEWTEPSLTSISIPLESAGKSAVVLYRILLENPELDSLSSSFDHDIIYRESTKASDQSRITIRVSHHDFSPLLDADYENDMRRVWAVADTYSTADETDRRILRGILDNISNSGLAEKNYISESTLHYRLNKLYKSTGVSGKSELKTLLKKYFPHYNC